MQNATRVILILFAVAVIVGGVMLINAVVDAAVERNRWGVVILFAAGMSPLIGAVTLGWFLIH